MSEVDRNTLIRYWSEQIASVGMTTDFRRLVRVISERGGMPLRYVFFHDTANGRPALFALVIDAHGTWYGHRYYRPDDVVNTPPSEIQRANANALFAPDESIEEDDLPQALADFHIRNSNPEHAIPELTFIVNILLNGPPRH